ncbi:MAG: hypothetical protein K0R67_229 [Paenibacillus sp.]|nr:hypothetical protein [Paenibacillus sp.]
MIGVARLISGRTKRKWVVKRKGLLRRGRRQGGKSNTLSTSQHGAYNDGYNSGFDKGHAEGYRQGKYDGEAQSGWRDGIEGMIDSMTPAYEIMPELSAEQIIEAGIEHLRGHFRHLLTPEELGGQIVHALNTRTPMSVVRLGDGELLTLAQGSVLSIAQVQEQGSFLGYAGVTVPDYEARDQLADSVRKATVVGIPKLRVRNYQPLAFEVFRAHAINHRHLNLTDSLINYYLYQAGFLSRIVTGRRVLIVGTLADQLGDLLRTHGVHVVTAVSPVHGVADVARVMGEIGAHEFDLALVAAGIAAVIVSQRIASDLGKVAIDFGHLANSMIKGEAPFK